MNYRNLRFITALCLSIAVWGDYPAFCAQPTFNMDLLEKNESLPAVDLQNFSQQNVQPEGRYLVSWIVNGVTLDARREFAFHHDQKGQLAPCLTRATLQQAGANPVVLAQNSTGADAQACLNLDSILPGGRVSFDFAHQNLELSIPQALMDRKVRDNVPISQWDEGISAFQLNYRYSGASQKDNQGGTESDNYLMLKNGLNVGAWRLRSDGSLTANSQDKMHWNSSGSWLERDFVRWKSELTLGDAFTAGDVFDSVQVQGVGLASDDEMLPDSQKGFAPTIHGIAHTNAQVTISQNGDVLYQTYVTPGAFVIDDLYPTASSGDLDVSVKESDGEIRRFTQPYASVTQMQREGYLKYSTIVGRYHTSGGIQRPLMSQISLMRGLSHNVTLFGGLQVARQYHNLSFGIGKGLGESGAVSLQVSRSRANVSAAKDRGQAWRLQYSKGFEKSGTLFTLNVWRYSHDCYLSLGDAFANENDTNSEARKKTTQQLVVNQTIAGDVSLYINLDRDQYWSVQPAQHTASIGVSSQNHGVSWSLSYGDTHSSEENNDRVITLSLSMPLSKFLPDSYVSYSLSSSRQNGIAQMVGLNGTLSDTHSFSYSIEQSVDSHTGHSGDISLGYSGNKGEVNASYSEDSQSTRLSYGASGGLLIHGSDFILSPEMNGPVVLVDAGGASGVALANQKNITTNAAGFAILPFATAYHRNDIALDSHSLPDDVDLTTSAVITVPTKDAVVMARFKTHVGYKALFVLQAGGKALPFGTQVSSTSATGSTDSIVANNGQVYLAGLAQKGSIEAYWGPAGNQHCIAHYDLAIAQQQISSSLIRQQTLSCIF
ncbi:fimbria/pilus outer membrane usher protein [Raoultella terrigena]|uniref:fimbria/pilus outer membrane usher protein n=1 Tax=Raoultella terrigena TaxID=577 RepID=UPI0009753E9F|nr:fimbrial protein [Raoultella terrigena]